MSGSIIISPTRAPSHIVGGAGADAVGEWARLARGRVLHSDLDAFEWHRLVRTLSSNTGITLIKGARTTLTATDPVRLFVAEVNA